MIPQPAQIVSLVARAVGDVAAIPIAGRTSAVVLLMISLTVIAVCLSGLSELLLLTLTNSIPRPSIGQSTSMARYHTYSMV